MRQTTISWWAALLLSAWTVLSTQAGILNVNQKYQEQNQWCWSATCQSTLEFYGIKETQTNIAIFGTGQANVWNYLWGEGNPGDGIYRRGCDQILTNFGFLVSSGTATSMPFALLQSEIASNRPVVVNWQWDAGGGHILLAYGLVNSNVFLMDPWYGQGVYDYDWVCRGGGAIPMHIWGFTLRIYTSSMASNNVPRWWLGSYGLTNNWNVASTNDPDLDSVPTYQEYIADTDPITNSSKLTAIIGTPDNQPGKIVISWLASSNRLYSVQVCSNLAQPTSWTNIAGYADTNGTGATMSYTNNLPGTSEFYRVKASLKP